MGQMEKQENILLVLVKFSLPLIFSGILQQLYSWADAFIVGNVEGELSLAAIGATGTVIGFFVMVMTGFTAGLGILFARKFGAGQTEILRRILSTFLVVVGGAMLAFSVIGFFLAQPMLALLHTPADIFDLSKIYLQLSFIGMPFLAVYNVYFAALRAIGDSKAPFWAILFSSAVNIALDILLVAWAGWGVTGAAVATSASQILMVAFTVCYTVRWHKILRFRVGAGMLDMVNIPCKAFPIVEDIPPSLRPSPFRRSERPWALASAVAPAMRATATIIVLKLILIIQISWRMRLPSF